jgi:hypothetical protein
MNYTVTYGQSITDAVINSTGTISAWSQTLDDNNFNDWTPSLSSGQVLYISNIVNTQNIQQLTLYPSVNQLSNNVYNEIIELFAELATVSPIIVPEFITEQSVKTIIIYTVKPGEVITDAVLNSTGNIGNWDIITNANNLDWDADLLAGQILTIPINSVYDNNSFFALNLYPANNSSVADIYSQIDVFFESFAWILSTGYWNGNGLWLADGLWLA